MHRDVGFPSYLRWKHVIDRKQNISLQGDNRFDRSRYSVICSSTKSQSSPLVNVSTWHCTNPLRDDDDDDDENKGWLPAPPKASSSNAKVAKSPSPTTSARAGARHPGHRQAGSSLVLPSLPALSSTPVAALLCRPAASIRAPGALVDARAYFSALYAPLTQ